MGDLVDARLPSLRRVPLADRDEDKGRLRRFFVARQHSSPPPSGTRKIELDAAAETSPISPFLFAAPQPFIGHTVSANLDHHRLDRCRSRRGGPSEILRQELLVHADREARTPTRAQGPTPRRR